MRPRSASAVPTRMAIVLAIGARRLRMQCGKAQEKSESTFKFNLTATRGANPLRASLVAARATLTRGPKNCPIGGDLLPRRAAFCSATPLRILADAQLEELAS